MAFALDPRLAADTVPVADMTLSRVLLINDQRFPWLILVPRRENVTELIDLSDLDVATLYNEVRLAGRALQDLTGADKLNIAALGNMVAQLHVHVIARSKRDAAWPKPVWGFGTAEAYEPQAQAAFVADVQRALTSE